MSDMWEYNVHWFDAVDLTSGNVLGLTLNSSFGIEGWELVTVTAVGAAGAWAFFKRPSIPNE